jgi:hypothetical protein
LENNLVQLENAKEELAKPFMFEAEFAEKSARLAELDAKLNMDNQPDSNESQEVDVDGQETPEDNAQSHDLDVNLPPNTTKITEKPPEKPDEIAAKIKGHSFADQMKSATDRSKALPTDKPPKTVNEVNNPEQIRKKSRDSAR